MQCPKCHFENEADATECLKCGIVFAKYVPHATVPETLAIPLDSNAEARRELWYRGFALPVALIASRFMVKIAPGPVRLLTMWVHELGHAVTAWLCGFGAMPGPWYTSVSDQRSIGFALGIAALAGFGGYYGWQKRRYSLLAGCALIVVLQIAGWRMYSDQAQALIIFGGDAGCFVLGSILMMTFYASRDTAIYQNSLRWGFLGIGAAAFMDAYATWTGGLATIPFGENENGMSDPSVLTEVYPWSVQTLIQRYDRLAAFCLTVLAIVYLSGLASAAISARTRQFGTIGSG